MLLITILNTEYKINSKLISKIQPNKTVSSLKTEFNWIP